MPFSYHSVQINSNPTGMQRNIVNITKGPKKGTKRVERYDSKGKLINKVQKTLTAPQIKKILNGVFIPGLFKDCCTKPRSKTRRANRRSN